MKIIATLTTLALLLIAGCGIPKEITSAIDGKTMVLIPAGEFEMGSNDEDARNNEQPVHTVYVDAFYMDTHEVTNAEYQKFVLANPQWQKERIRYTFNSSSYLKHWNGNNYPAGKANHPVIYVGWYAAMAYAEWAGKRLPTEAEWEKAARGGLRGKKYPWGDSIDSNYANFGNKIKGTTAVGSYIANGYGLYDMAGNVWEWCLDEYDADFYSVSPPRNPLSGAPSVKWLLANYIVDYIVVKSNQKRVVRGGSWFFSAHLVRVANRSGLTPSFSTISFGFRCARDVKP